MIVILMAIAIVGLIGAGSLAIDIGSALVTKTELQNVSDASSLAATRELALIYKEQPSNTDYKKYTLTSDDRARIQNKALAFAAANKAGGVSITVGSDDVVTATYDIKTGETTPSETGARAVVVTGRRDDTQNGQVQTALGRVLGIDQIAITATSAAAISALGSLKGGKGEFPVGLDEDWFGSHACDSGETIKFYPTSPTSCAGWHTFTSKPASASKLGNIVDGIKDGTFSSPEVIAGETRFEFVGGTIASKLPNLKELFEEKRVPQDATGTFTTTVPVYESSGCLNPNQDLLIVGFARLTITKVQAPPDEKLVEGVVKCGVFDEGELGEGNGPGDFGTLVGTPGMIQ